MEYDKLKNQFGDLYIQLERTLKEHYETAKISKIDYEKQGLLKYKDEIEMYKNLRNILSHNLCKGRIQFTQKLIDEIKVTLNEITASIEKLKISKVFKCSYEDEVLKAIKEMHECDYTSIPIVEEDRVIGFFSESILFRIIAEGQIIDKSTTFNDIRLYTAIQDDVHNRSYEFITPDTPRNKALHIISKAQSNQYRIDVLFVTSDGTAQGNLLGLITPWDLFVAK